MLPLVCAHGDQFDQTVVRRMVTIARRWARDETIRR
jgi:hypothetical protein